MLKLNSVLTKETYYNDTSYLSSSLLGNFVTFTLNGTPIYNMLTFLNPPKVDSKATKIGTAVDGELTEGKFVDEIYGPALLKDDLIQIAKDHGLEIRERKTKDGPADTVASIRQKLTEVGYIFMEEIDSTSYEAIKTMLATAYSMQYDANTSYVEFIKECDSQCMVTDDEWMMKGKFDHINHKRKVIADLKTTGKFDMFLKEIQFNGYVNIHHRYVRQLAIYRELVKRQIGEYYDCQLIVLGYSGQAIILNIPASALDAAFVQIQKDIEVLNTFRFPGDTRNITLVDSYAVNLMYTPSIDIPQEIVDDDAQEIIEEEF